MNFSSFKAEATSNAGGKRAGAVKGQSFDDLKFKVNEIKDKATGNVLGEEGRFYLSKKRFAEFGLTEEGTNNGLRQFVGDGAVIIAVVAADDAVILKGKKGSKKGSNFKSTRLEAALTNLAVLKTGVKE